jgi:DNA repair exonuclease SbcCD ATPase subunit
MRLSYLKLRDFGCFRGEHVLELGNKAYGIFAQLRGDAERSNWLGKSTLCKSVYFALYGEHDHRYDDDIISRGEPSGEVELGFDEEYIVRRSRQRGKRTTLYFEGPERETAMQDEAQLWIEKVLGMGKEDFRATCYFEQRQMARFILTEPSTRMKMVSAWFRLGPLETCEALVRKQGTMFEDAAIKIEGHFAAMDRRACEIAQAYGWEEHPPSPEGLRADLELAIATTAKELEEKMGRVGALEDNLEKNAKLMAGKSKVQDFDQIVTDGKKTKEELEKFKLPVLKTAWEEASKKASTALADLRVCTDEARKKSELARGQFDGACPVARIQCPARAQINEDRKTNVEVHAAAEEARKKSVVEYETLNAEATSLRGNLDMGTRLEARLLALRDQAKKMTADVKAAKEAPEPADPAHLRAQLEQARSELLEVKGKHERLKGWAAELDAAEVTKKTLSEKREEIARALGVCREGAVIFGKGGAQRRVAESALTQIQDMANEALRECGANLRVDARWSREGKDIASACDTCGNPFPKSARVKTCERCGAARGNKLENKLDIVLSDRSGAAEDLAGGFLQLAASRWLREERGTSWSMAMLDEPFGALDAAHRKGFGSHLATMLSSKYGFDQSFVVAHHSSVLDSLPGRILIESDGGWSVPKVIA